MEDLLLLKQELHDIKKVARTHNTIDADSTQPNTAAYFYSN